MTTSGAYEDEMRPFLRLSDEDVSRLLAGESGASTEALNEVASLIGEVRATFAASVPEERVRNSHLAAMSEASRLTAGVTATDDPTTATVTGSQTWRKVMDRTAAFALKALAGTVAASMSMVGLAFAGVDLPGNAAERAFAAVTGVELPNQSSDDSSTDENQGSPRADDVKAVLDGDLEGCERGQAVADAADANRQDEAKTKDDPCTKGEDEDADDDGDAKGSKATGDAKSAEGRAKASEKSGGRSESRGSDASTEGRGTATEKSEGASDSGADNADSGADNAGTNDDQGRATGSDASTDGQSNAEDGQAKAEEVKSNRPDRP